MRSPLRLVTGLLGLALAAPLVGASAQESRPAHAGQSDPIYLEQGRASAQPGVSSTAPRHEHKGLLGRRNCNECQRQRAMERDGINVPPPPAMPAAIAAHQRGHAHAHATAAPAGAAGTTGCVACEADAAAMGGTIVPGSIVVTDSASMPPGRAVVGGTEVAADFPAGRAVVGGPEPSPVGVARASQGNFTPVAAAVAAGGTQGPLRDPSVMPSSMIPPAQTAIGADTGTPRPRIIKHMLDLPDLGGIGRSVRANRSRASREAHAAISYDAPNGKVDELPASMVYGKGGR